MNAWARYFAGVAPGAYDRRPMWLMGEMSMRTGGFFCPLMPKCNELPGKNPDPNHWYICPVSEIVNPDGSHHCPTTRILDPNLRDAGTHSTNYNSDWGDADHMGLWQNCAILEMTKSQQAEKCALDTIGQNPYMLMKTDGF